MRTLPTALTAEIAKEVYSIGHLIRMTLYNPTTQQDLLLYYTNKDMDVVYDNGTGLATYLSRGIEFTGGQQGLTPKVDNVSFSINNTALEFSSYVMSYDTRGRDCVIYRAAFDEYLQVIGVATLFVGVLDRVEVNQQRATFDVTSTFVRWGTQTPRRKHSSSCWWTFKDTDTCRYSGSTYTDCDKSYDACTARANTINFGGMRWIDDLQNKQTRWGS